MKQKNVDLINVNEAKSLLSSGGLDHLAAIIYKCKTVTIGSRAYITKRQFENCLKKEVSNSVNIGQFNFIKYVNKTS